MSFALRPLAAVLLGCGSLLLLVACGPVHSVTVGRAPHPAPYPEVHEGHRHGPPPHAPAHGYRRKHERAYRGGGEVELVFDSGLGVYMVVGMPDFYFWNGSYLHIEGGAWVTSTYLDGSWKPCSDRSVPPGLRAKHAKAGKKSAGKGKGKGKGPAKQRD